MACDTYGGKGDVGIGFWCADLRGRVHLADPGVDGRIILQGIFKKLVGARIILIWFRIGAGGGVL